MPKYYVYTLSYPPRMGGAVFYVGKGSGKRIDRHEYVAKSGKDYSACADAIRAVWDAGHQIVKAKVYQTDDELEAMAKEREIIASYGLSNLTNKDKGGCGFSRTTIAARPPLTLTSLPVKAPWSTATVKVYFHDAEIARSIAAQMELQVDRVGDKTGSVQKLLGVIADMYEHDPEQVIATFKAWQVITEAA